MVSSEFSGGSHLEMIEQRLAVVALKSYRTLRTYALRSLVDPAILESLTEHQRTDERRYNDGVPNFGLKS